MIFTEEWLRQYVNPALTTDELSEALTMAGLEVEEVRTVAGLHGRRRRRGAFLPRP